MAPNLNHRQQIAEIFNSATNKLQVAVSWFTDETLYEQLLSLSRRLKIELLLSADEVNLLRHHNIEALKKAGVKVLKSGNSCATDGNFMHSKMVIVDGITVHGGSYNFTENARTNMENFACYEREAGKKYIEIFSYWWSSAVDIFDGVANVKELISSMKSRFVAESKKRESLINSISKELTEREEILRVEIEKEKHRKALEALNEKKAGISQDGKLSAGPDVIKSQPHRFYGGSLRTHYTGEKRKNGFAMAYRQKIEIQRRYSFLRCHVSNDTLICTGVIQPENCQAYRVRIEFRAGWFPRVYILNPSIEINPEVHIYAEGSLCLFFPGDFRWKDTTSISEYTIPWIFDWILNYELYLLTGRWEGESVEHGHVTASNFDENIADTRLN